MATELSRRLADMAERGRSRGPDAIMAAARAALDPTRAALTAGQPRRSGWAFALGAATLALVLVGSVALLPSRSTREPAGTTGGGITSTTLPPGTSATSSATTTTAAGPLPSVGACPEPAPLPPELADLLAFERLHTSVLTLAQAVNRLPQAVRQGTDFEPGWMDRAPVAQVADDVDAAAWSVYDDAAAILHQLGVTGDLPPFVYPPDWDTMPSWVSHIEEMALNLPARMAGSLDELGQARSLQKALEHLSNGGTHAGPCGVASATVLLADTAFADRVVEGVP